MPEQKPEWVKKWEAEPREVKGQPVSKEMQGKMNGSAPEQKDAKTS
jgi:hypothetical protein